MPMPDTPLAVYAQPRAVRRRYSQPPADRERAAPLPRCALMALRCRAMIRAAEHAAARASIMRRVMRSASRHEIL